MRRSRLPELVEAMAADRRTIPLLDDDMAWGAPRRLFGPDLWAEIGRGGRDRDEGTEGWGERV